MNDILVKLHSCSVVCFERFSTSEKVVESWDVEYQLVKKCYTGVVELSDVNSGDKVFEVLADTFEPKVGERGEDATCEGLRMSVCLVWARSRGSKLNGK